MSEVLVLASFIIALFIGVFIGKIIFTAKFQSEKNVFEEKLNALKEQSQIEKSSFDKVLLQLNTEKEQIRTEKEVANIQLAKKEADFDSLLEKNKDQKQEVEQLQEKFTKEFENLANKILEEKTNKFTEQNKENMKNILTPLQDKILHFEKKSRRYTQRKYRLPCSIASANTGIKRNECANE